MKRVLFYVLMIALLISSCGEANPSTNQGLLSLEDIPNGFDGPTIVSTTSTSASITFNSGVKSVCNAPYGLTTDYGQVATTTMMDGATNDHQVTFFDLEPESTYHYQITLTDVQGKVYQSGDFTFTTEVEDNSSSAGINWLSLEAGAEVIEVSSNYGGAANEDNYGANNAIDGSESTAWSSNGDGDGAFLTVSLAEPVHITSLSVHTRTMSNDTAQIFEFTVTTDNGETFGPFTLPDASQAYDFEVDFIASTLRFDAVSTNTGNTGFVEIAAFGILVSEE